MNVPMHRLSIIMVFTTLAAVIVACGGPSGPAIPDATSLTPTVAERGDSIVIAGSGFGTAPGSVLVGGVAATASDWTDTSITITVPAGAPNAWQDVNVTTAGGSDSVGGLFVGIEYTGSATGLQAALDGLDRGTAVLLQAATYDLTAQVTPFVIDNVDLYGRGASQTSVTLPTATQTIALADFGATTTLADLSFVGDNFVYLHGTVADTDLPWAVMGAVAFSEHELMDGVSLDRWSATDWDSASLRAAAIAPPRLVLDGVTHNEATSGLWGALGFSASLVDVVLRGSTLEFGNGVVALVSVGDITIESSSVTSGTLTVATPTGTVNVADSAIESTGPTVFGAERGLQVIDSAVLITDGSLQVIGNAATAMTGSTQPTGGPIEFKGSTVEVLDSDLLDASNHGGVTMLTQFAPISLVDNVLLRSHDDFTILTLDSQHGEADIELRGNIDVRVGVFVTESAAGARAADLTVQTMGSGLRNRVTLQGNTLAVSQGAYALTTGSGGNIYVTDNDVTTGDSATTGVVVFAATTSGVVEMSENTVTTNGNVQVQGSDLADGTMLVSGNEFTNLTAEPGGFVMLASNGSCVVTDNVLAFDDPSDATVQSATFLCLGTGAGHTFTATGNDLTATGSATSGVVLLGGTLDRLDAVDNRIETGQTVQFVSDADTSVIMGNTVIQSQGSLVVDGGNSGSFTISGNTVTQHQPVGYALSLLGLDEAVVTDNTFTGVGTPAADATTLSVTASTNSTVITATGNTFTNFSRALRFVDQAVTANGIDASINDNVFAFTIDAAPKVATLTNVKDEIDASNNQWGSNTNLATVEGYVTLAGDTVGQGGSILLDPLKLP